MNAYGGTVIAARLFNGAAVWTRMVSLTPGLIYSQAESPCPFIRRWHDCQKQSESFEEKSVASTGIKAHFLSRESRNLVSTATAPFRLSSVIARCSSNFTISNYSLFFNVIQYFSKLRHNASLIFWLGIRHFHVTAVSIIRNLLCQSSFLKTHV